MIDLHCHILPGVDDGARTLEDAVAMARMAYDAGTRTVVATPHMLHPMFDVTGDVARERHAALVAALATAGIELEVLLAGEIHYSVEIPEGLASGRLIPLANERRYILFELPAANVPGPFPEVLWQLQRAGVHPVLAHPERNRELAAKPKTSLAPYRERHLPIQVTAMSLTGDFGRSAKKAAQRWVKDGLVDIVASDGHSLRSRPPVMDAAARVVRKLAGPTVEQWVTEEAPRRLLAGELLPSR